MSTAYIQLADTVMQPYFSAISARGYLRKLLSICITIAAGSFIFPQASAQTLSTPSIIGNNIPIEKVNDIKNQPLALLAKFPEAGAAMVRYVAQIITKEPPLVDSVLSVIKDTSPEQASAIGAGLVRALRSLEATQPALSQNLAAKIMRSDNLWMKTTFRALGPNYVPNTNRIAAEPLPSQPANNLHGSDELPLMESRIGPTRRIDFVPERQDATYNSNIAKQKVSGLFDQYGMIVATISSDASANGAYSTSPTQ